jgi:hypothetical protein
MFSPETFEVLTPVSIMIFSEVFVILFDQSQL